jgi:hypothetical protein
MNDLTRAERIEEYKSLIESEIETLRAVRDVTSDPFKWEDLDQQIDGLLIAKDNAAAEIDAAMGIVTVTKPAWMIEAEAQDWQATMADALDKPVFGSKAWFDGIEEVEF